MERSLAALHRWLGVALALLMTLWSVSGIVMVYVAFPELTETEYYSGLEPLKLGKCCAGGVGETLGRWPTVTIEMLDGRPVAKVGDGSTPRRILDLLERRWHDEVSIELARAVASDHMSERGMHGSIVGVSTIENDQWTVYGRFKAHRPLYRIQFDSPHADVLYVSGTSAEVVQDTHARERFWNWLGAVPHWLYFRAIRQHQVLWYNLVVYASLFGTCLVISGLYLGVRRALESGNRWTPFVGLMRWHHMTGLIFGLLTLTWTFSGLLSMNPWGWLESRGTAEELARLERRSVGADAVDRLLARANSHLGGDVVSLTLTADFGDGTVISVNSKGEKRRFIGNGLQPSPPTGQEIEEWLSLVRPDSAVESIRLLNQEDSYYFAHKSKARLPVIRAILADSERTRYYFDAATGELLARIDQPSKSYRWLHHGLHRLDFTAALRVRPFWDVLIIVMLLGVTLLCAVGCWIGYRHLRYRRWTGR